MAHGPADEKWHGLEPRASTREHESGDQARRGEHHDDHTEHEANPEHGPCFLHDQSLRRQGASCVRVSGVSGAPWRQQGRSLGQISRVPWLGECLRVPWAVRVRALGPYLLDAGERGSELVDPRSFVSPDQLDAPGERLAPASCDPGVDERVEDQAL